MNEARRKTTRGPNFSEAERVLLIKIANKYRNVIESQKTDAVSWRDKEATWRKICQVFNSACEGAPRNVKQIQQKYKAIKKLLRKQHSTHMAYMKGTGGGPYIPPPSPKNEEEKTLVETIKLSTQGLENQFDSDGRAGVIGILPESVVSQEKANNDFADTEIVEAAEMIESTEMNWTSSSCILWQTPKDPRLVSEKNKKDNVLVDETQINVNTEKVTDEFDTFDDHDYTPYQSTMESESPLTASSNMTTTHTVPENHASTSNDNNQENITVPIEEQQKSTWASRRRPILKKRKTVTSTAARFEVVAEKKLELICCQKMIAENKLLQDKKEHELKMEILHIKKSNERLKNQLLSEGKMVFDF